jgi:hypothetical protein
MVKRLTPNGGRLAVAPDQQLVVLGAAGCAIAGICGGVLRSSMTSTMAGRCLCVIGPQREPHLRPRSDGRVPTSPTADLRIKEDLRG